MNELEILNKCFNLIWDYDDGIFDDDIENFQHENLRTWPQYNKINDYLNNIEWHNMEDCLPEESKEVVLRLQNDESEYHRLGYYDGEQFVDNISNDVFEDKVVAWKYVCWKYV